MQVASGRGQALRSSQVRRVAAGQLRPRRTGLVCSATAEVLRSADAPAGSAAPAIKLFYRTGWDKAVAHGSLAGAAWTDFPLVKVSDLDGTMSWWEDAGALAGGVLVGKDAMHFRPAEEQNDHKVTCGVADAAAGGVVARVNSELAAAGVSANVITSGHGGWKYMDVVPIRAGKLEALNHVRRHFGFSVASTVASYHPPAQPRRPPPHIGNNAPAMLLFLATPSLFINHECNSSSPPPQPDLRTWAQQRQAAEAPLPSGKHRLLQATKKEALGILEGLEHFGFK
eukprot:XP_001697708.1 predicted protein [Chlamydomonas reinhardtii]